jgi:hypothetical protein
MRTDLRSFTRQFVNATIDSLEQAISNPDWRKTAIGDARQGWAILNRRLAHDDVPQELQAINARLALLFEFEGFPEHDDEHVEARLRELIEEIDKVYPTEHAHHSQ